MTKAALILGTFTVVTFLVFKVFEIIFGTGHGIVFLLSILFLMGYSFLAVGLPLSAVGFYRNRKRGENLGMSSAAIAMNILAVIILALIFALGPPR